uniref:Uncharacterized protein n=1 Tax=Anguilla anguilla TaxID=7936 RepID=A0A0E9XQ74_ANGAN
MLSSSSLSTVTALAVTSRGEQNPTSSARRTRSSQHSAPPKHSPHRTL